MKIERVWSQIVRLPADEPLADGKTVPGATRDIVVVKVATKDGIEGLGVTFFGAGMTGALKVACEELGALAVGENPHHVERIADKLRQRRRHLGPWRRLHAGPVGHRHGPVGHPRQGPGRAARHAARGLSRPRARLRQRRPDAHAVARRGRDGGRHGWSSAAGRP